MALQKNVDLTVTQVTIAVLVSVRKVPVQVTTGYLPLFFAVSPSDCNWSNQSETLSLSIKEEFVIVPKLEEDSGRNKAYHYKRYLWLSKRTARTPGVQSASPIDSSFVVIGCTVLLCCCGILSRCCQRGGAACPNNVVDLCGSCPVNQ